jgi:hypothetical protein
MLTTFPEITTKVERLEEIKKLLDEKPENSIEFIEEQNEIIERMLLNEAYQKHDLQQEILKYFGFSKEQLSFKISQLS